MNTYMIAIVPLLAVPFLLYCLWNFARELRRMKSTKTSIFPISASKLRPVTPLSQPSRRPQIVSMLQGERSTESLESSTVA